jgi:hypothetical protein
MKNDRILLASWLGDYTDGYVDIPWPEVHKQAGSDIIHWINRHKHTDVQMILDKNNSGSQSLWAEFYNNNLRLEFALLFAK